MRKKCVLLALFIIYLIVLFKITTYRDANSELRGINLIPFVTISEYSQEILNGNRIMGIFNILGNLIMFFPFGYISAVLFPKIRRLTKILMLALVFSIVLEGCQYIFACGSTDIDDVILNMIGGMVGYWVYALISRLFDPKKYAISISTLMIAVTCTGYYARNDFKFIVPHPPMLEESSGDSSEQPPRLLPEIVINSSNALFIQLNRNENKVLFDKGGQDKIYPASMTKIMTAIVVLENIKDLASNITLNEQMFTDIYNSNSSVAGFLPGEKVRALDLIYGLMLPSGAECAIGLAEYVSGTESAFVDLMNKKARQIGMSNTHFTNTVGLHNQEHYSTLKDIAVLVEYAIKNDTFYKVFTTARYSTKPTNLHKDGITFYSTLFSKMKSKNFNDYVILGGKTGYTREAGQCLASLAEKNDNRFIMVTCGAPGDNTTHQLHIDDAITIFNRIN